MGDFMEQKNHMERKRRSISLRSLNWLTAVLLLLISGALLVSTYRISGGYKDMRASTDSYIRWQQSAHDLQSGSDYLTEQARYFAVTGVMAYLNNYFEEAAVTRRRDRALAMLKEELSGTEADLHLSAALRESVSLMEREYYSMRLVAEANRYPLESLPEQVRNVALTSDDRQLSAKEQRELALSMLTDGIYREKKDLIVSETQKCLSSLIQETKQEQHDTSEQLRLLLRRQQAMIALLIVIVLGVRLLTVLLAITPLLKAVLYIQDEQPIPIHGAREFQFLAHTYNEMYEVNRERTNRLTFSATHDKLTGAFNRRGYEYLLNTLDLGSCALALIDVDLFKQVNDTYGHETGDRVLAAVAEKLHDSFLSESHVCRIGGDEFAVILVHVGAELKEALRQTFRRINEELGNPAENIPPVSLSIGVAFGGDGIDAAALLHHADEALYSVKKNGRGGSSFYK